MFQILEFFKQIINFAYELMNYPITFYGFSITLWQVFMFILIGSILWWVIQKIYDND